MKIKIKIKTKTKTKMKMKTKTKIKIKIIIVIITIIRADKIALPPILRKRREATLATYIVKKTPKI